MRMKLAGCLVTIMILLPSICKSHHKHDELKPEEERTRTKKRHELDSKNVEPDEIDGTNDEDHATHLNRRERKKKLLKRNDGLDEDTELDEYQRSVMLESEKISKEIEKFLNEGSSLLAPQLSAASLLYFIAIPFMLN